MPPELVTPALFIGPDVNEDDLPNGIEAAAAFLAERQQVAIDSGKRQAAKQQTDDRGQGGQTDGL
ncbi:MAG: hypothetical protein WCB27_07235 [Thermoguttaceae bacterium]